MLPNKQAIICCYIFSPHLINASTLPCEVDLPIDTHVTSELTLNNCWTIFHS